jgi:amino acid transporter
MRSQAAQLVAVTSASPIILRYVLLMSLQYATAMFKVLYSYSGWQTANYVLNDVKNPVRTLKIAGPLALGITATLYIFANIAYFAFVPPNVPDKFGPMISPTQRIVEDRHPGV